MDICDQLKDSIQNDCNPSQTNAFYQEIIDEFTHLKGLNNPTSAATWRERAEADPHDDRYDCGREDLLCGHITDDDLANRQFLVEGKIHLQTIVKDRIRWLSRALVKTNAELEVLRKTRT
ncbi:MAG: hypothetical protein V7727_00245 [Sneathiella sp.]